MRRAVLMAAFLSFAPAAARSAPAWTPILQEAGLHFSSDRVTVSGLGAGGGLQLVWRKRLVAQADAGLLWGNGNAVPIRLALGLQGGGTWTPAIFGTFGLLFGQRTEVLSETGLRPAGPVWMAGLRAARLRFTGRHGCASALELGYGIGANRGRYLELTLLSVGAHL